jgi:hypothetical protein
MSHAYPRDQVATTKSALPTFTSTSPINTGAQSSSPLGILSCNFSKATAFMPTFNPRQLSKRSRQVQVGDSGLRNTGFQFGMSHLSNWRKSMFLQFPSQVYCHLSSTINSGIHHRPLLQDCRMQPIVGQVPFNIRALRAIQHCMIW